MQCPGSGRAGASRRGRIGKDYRLLLQIVTLDDSPGELVPPQITMSWSLRSTALPASSIFPDGLRLIVGNPYSRQ
jgi:hypothetical protein